MTERDDLDVLAAQASNDLLVGLGRLRRHVRGVSTDDDLTPSQSSVLARLRKQGAQSASDLAALEGVRPQSMATILTALTGRGLVERHPDPDDGRRALVTLTPMGKDRSNLVQQGRIDWLATALRDGCSAREIKAVVTAMAALDRIVDS